MVEKFFNKFYPEKNMGLFGRKITAPYLKEIKNRVIEALNEAQRAHDSVPNYTAAADIDQWMIPPPLRIQPLISETDARRVQEMHNVIINQLVKRLEGIVQEIKEKLSK